MLLSKQHRLRALYIAKRNPIWAQLGINLELKPTAFLEAIGVNPNSMREWMKGAKFAKRTMTRLFNDTRSKILDKIPIGQKRAALLALIKTFEGMYERAAVDRPKVRLYEAARVLGMSLDDSQIVIDQAIAEERPLWPALYYDNKQRDDQKRADRHYRHFRGVYFAYVRRDDAWLQCPLRVRYLLPLQGENLLAIRCKLNLPLIDPAQGQRLKAVQTEDGLNSYFEYDSWLSAQEAEQFAYWMCEKRLDEDRVDYFHFITDWGRGGEEDRAFRLYGTYLTVSQDDPQRITSDVMIIERLAAKKTDTDEKIIKMMRQPGIANRALSQKLDQLAKKHWPQKKKANVRRRARSARPSGKAPAP